MKIRFFPALVLIVTFAFGSAYFHAQPDGYMISIDDISVNFDDDAVLQGFCNAFLSSQDGFSNVYTYAQGLPAMPVYRRFIRIPEDADIEIAYSVGNQYNVDLDKAGFNHGIHPRQPSWAKKDATRPDSVIDSDFYAQNTNYPTEMVTIEYAGVIRGKKIAVLTVSPVSYNPAENELVYYDGIDISVSFSQPIQAIPPRLVSNAFTGGLFSMILEPAHIEPVVSAPAVYLIITAPAFVSHLDEFTRALSRWGYDVHIATTAETGEDAEDITDYIAEAYLNWDTAPSFVLFVGDDSGVAPYMFPGSGPWSDGHPSDLPHFTIDGDDFFPDIMYGRMSVTTPEELDNLIAKTLVHYYDDYADPSAHRRIGFGACGTDGRWEFVMGTHQYAMDRYFHPPDFEPDSVYAIYGAGTTELVNMINDGIFIFNYSGHGVVDEFANPRLTYSDIASLTNTTYPLVIGNCCLTGKFDEDCFAERITNSPHAASSYIGASNVTYWDEDDIWEKKLYDGIFTEDFAYLASFKYKGNLEVYLHDYSSAEYYFEIYHSFGDPALTFYFGDPDTLDVDMADYDYIVPGMDEYVFYPSVANSWVALSTGDELYGAASTAAGSATVSVRDFFEFPDTVLLVAHRPNFWKPFIVEIPTASPADITIVPDSIPVGIATEVTITIEADSEPLSMADVFIDGFGVAETLLTSPEGIATVTITPPYGEVLTITGRSAEGLPLGRAFLPVYGALSWTTSVYAATPAIGMIDSIAVNLPGIIELTASPGDFSVMLDQPSSMTMTLETDLETIIAELTPLVTNNFDVAFLKDGYEVNHDIVIVCQPRRYPEIMVVEEGSRIPVPNAELMLYEVGTDVVVLTGITDSDGIFIGSRMIDCKFYDLAVNAFGYVPYSATIPMVIDGRVIIEIERGAVGTITGTTGISKTCRVSLLDPVDYRVLAEVLTASDGSFTFADMPYYNYKIVASSRGYGRHLGNLEVSSPEVTYTANLDPADPPVLIIDNTGGRSGPANMVTDIFNYHGFIPDIVTSFDLNLLCQYEVVIYSSGENRDPVVIGELETLLEYHRLGGNIILEGGEIGYDVTELADMTFAHELFHVSGWRADNPRGITAAEGSDLTKSPFTDPSYWQTEMGFASAGMREFYKFDVLTPMDDAVLLYESNARAGSGVAIKFDDDDNDGFKTILIYAFDYMTGIDNRTHAQMFILNGIEYVREPNWGRGKVFGMVTLEARDDFSDVAISSSVHNAKSWADGKFVVHADPGMSEITFSKSGFRDTTITVSVIPDGETWGINVHLGLASVAENYIPGSLNIVGPYPNPANASFAIQWNTELADFATVELFDVKGNAVMRKVVNSNNTIVNCDELDSGLYLYRVTVNEAEKSGKFVLIK